MRSKPPKKRTKTDSPTEPEAENSPDIRMEMELLALRAKNAEIIQNNTKLKQTIDEFRNQIFYLEKSLSDSEIKANRCELELAKIKQELQSCTPFLVKFLEVVIKNVGTDSPSTSNMLTISSLLTNEKVKTVTHAVGPRFVNGNELKDPIISLTRLNTSVANNRPSTSFEESEFVEVRRRSNFTPEVPEDADEVSDDEEEGNDAFDDGFVEEDEPDEAVERKRKLSMITEEAEVQSETTLIRTQRSSEIRITLPRLADLNSSNNLPNMTRTSTEGNIGDNTHYNFETTLIENTVRPRRGVNVLSDVVVTSPRASSTMLRANDEDLGESTTPLISPDIPWMPTPSAIGDIEGTKMDVFSDLHMDVDETQRTPCRITKRKAHSQNILEKSPKSSRLAGMLKNSLPHNFVMSTNSRNDPNPTPILSPKVILERLSTLSIPTTTRRTRSASKQNEENDDPSEKNNNAESKPTETKLGRKKRSKKSADDDEDVTKRVREMQVRLSNYSLPPTEHPAAQPQESRSRPHRAAKPTTLAECSRKCKLRRMF